MMTTLNNIQGLISRPEIVLACKAEPPDVEWPETLPFTLEDYQYLWGTVATNLEEHEVEVV